MTELFRHKAVIICGHFGTGKTNIAVNLALCAGRRGMNVSIADMDTVNPYFRTADNASFLEKNGVKVLLPQFANTNVDIPTLPPSLPLIFDGVRYSVTDVGGNEEGAVVIRGFRDRYEEIGYDMYYVFNHYRPENVDTEFSVASLRSIENATLLKFTGIINNSNLGVETTRKIVDDARKYAEDFACSVGLPLVMTTAFRQNAGENDTVIEDVTKKLY